MIDFACKRFNIKEIVKCSLGLSRAEYTVLDFLMNSKDALTTEEISKKTNLELSTVQRSVKKLHQKNVLKRRQNNLEGGGYVFIYSIENKSEMRKIILNIVHNWTKKVESELNNW
jgi:predicted transcriptional regulator